MQTVELYKGEFYGGLMLREQIGPTNQNLNGKKVSSFQYLTTNNGPSCSNTAKDSKSTSSRGEEPSWNSQDPLWRGGCGFVP